MSVLGAILANRVTGQMVDKFGPAPQGDSAAVPNLAELPAEVRGIIQGIYADATAELFLIGAPIAVAALLAVLFIKEKPLKTLSGDERLAAEASAGH